jgi:hypothetical protein
MMNLMHVSRSSVPCAHPREAKKSADLRPSWTGSERAKHRRVRKMRHRGAAMAREQSAPNHAGAIARGAKTLHNSSHDVIT